MLIAALAIFAMAVSGCGDGGDDGDTTASLTKAQFVKQANAICAKHNKQVATEFNEFAQEGNLEDRSAAEVTKAVADIGIPALKKQLDELQALPVPEGEEEEVELIFQRLERTIEKVEDEPSFRTSGDPYEELNKPAFDYGIAECGV